MKTVVLACFVFVWSITVRGQTNLWINAGDGAWQDLANWSLSLPPTNTQTLIITNDISKTVTIDSVTAGSYPEALTVSNIALSAPSGATNTMNLSGSGTNSPLSVLDTFTLSAGGLLNLVDATLWMQPTITNSFTNGVLSVDGIVQLNSNALLVADTGIYLGLDSSATGLVLLSGGNLLLTNTGASAIGVNGSGQLVLSNGQIQTLSGFSFVGSGIGSQGTLTIAGGSYVSGGLSRLVVGMETGAVGTVSVTGGGLVLTNALITLIGCDGAGEMNLLDGTNSFGALEIGGNPGSFGVLTVGGGIANLSSAVLLGSSPSSTGSIWLTGGSVVQTNSYTVSNLTNFFPTAIGPYGLGFLTMSNGNWLGNAMTLGSQSNSYGAVTVNGGSIQLLSRLLVGGTAVISNLVVGNCASGAIGVVTINGGSFYVTNAAHTAVLDVRDGQLILNSGLLQVDKLVMTNLCGLFVRNGGTLVVSSSLLATNLDADGDGMLNGWEQTYGLDPLNASDASADNDGDGLSNMQEYLAGTIPTNSASSLRILSILTEGNNLRVTWSAVTGKTYRVQRTLNIPTNFTDVATITTPASPVITQTNYLDVGGATSATARFYKIKLVTP